MNTEQPSKSAASWSYRCARRAEYSLSDLMLFATRLKFRPWKNWQLRWFSRKYAVNLAETPVQNFEQYPHFDSFFTRTLNEGVRTWPTDPAVLASPADGVLSECALVDSGATIQAKGTAYSLAALLGDDAALASQFRDGYAFTVYLAPHNYHRVHMPLDGELYEMRYVPGRLFSVKPRTVARVGDLFARNERTVSLFNTEHGRVAVIMVAAVFVGAISHPWAGLVTPPRDGRARRQTFSDRALHRPKLKVGAELGQFHMGSTVITVVEGPAERWQLAHPAGTAIEVGQPMAERR